MESFNRVLSSVFFLGCGGDYNVQLFQVLRKKLLASVSLWYCLACLKPVVQCFVGSLAFKTVVLKCDAFDTYVGRFIKDNSTSNDNAKEHRKD